MNSFKTISEAISNSKNVFISGVGGCGKTYLLKQLFQYFKEKKRCVLTSTTGISAYNLGGITVHSWCKIVIPQHIENVQEWMERLVTTLRKRPGIARKYQDLEVLFIDEVSMMGANYFDVLNYVCQNLRRNSKVFGGLQLVLSGDMMQLSPVLDNFVFESQVWDQCNLQFYRLVKAWRFDNQRWVDLLQRARVGKLNAEDCGLLNSRVNQIKQGQLSPIYLASKNSSVDLINKNSLEANTQPCVIFTPSDFMVRKNEDGSVKTSIPTKLSPEISSQFIVDSMLSLKLGCQVMLLANLDVENGHTNGARGLVKKIQGLTITVEFEGGVEKEIDPYSFPLEYKESHYSRLALPLKLAFATSIHKSQSLTLSSVEIDIGSDVFCEGQSYVALSRCKSLDGLFIRSLDLSKIKPNPKALQFELSFLKQCIDV